MPHRPTKTRSHWRLIAVGVAVALLAVLVAVDKPLTGEEGRELDALGPAEVVSTYLQTGDNGVRRHLSTEAWENSGGLTLPDAASDISNLEVGTAAPWGGEYDDAKVTVEFTYDSSSRDPNGERPGTRHYWFILVREPDGAWRIEDVATGL